MEDVLENRIKGVIASKPVVLFMKGTKSFPQCGFSARVVEILGRSGAEFLDVNVLADPELREGLKEYSSWPTFPQLYVRGELIGGCDIVTELYQKGELAKLLPAAG